MGQGRKILGVVVIGAAIAGWWMVRALSGGANHRVASPVAPAATVGAEIAPVVNASPPPGLATAATPRPPATANDDEATLIERDLALLAQGLLSDRQVEDHVMPRVNDVMNMPRLNTYRRAVDFWKPAFESAAETQP